MTAATIRTDRGGLPPERLAGIAAWIREGELVALPTETVYGIAARADDPCAIERLRAFKGRPDGKPFTIHLPDRVAAALHVAPPLPPAERLMRRYWPGPLTLVLPSLAEGWVGLRLPAREVTREVLRLAATPVVMTSANRADESPALDAREVENLHAGSLRAIVDDGPCEIRQSSTVVQVGPGVFRVHREGILTAEDARRTAGRRVLLVCAGNTCRSPMAEVLLRRALARLLRVEDPGIATFGYEIGSAGLLAASGAPASLPAVKAMREEGIDLSGHRTRPLTAELVRASDLVLVMTRSQIAWVRDLAPDCGHAIRLFDPGGEDTPDPFGGTLEDYRSCLARLRRGAEALAAHL